MGAYRVSMDIGGTFTDVVAYDEERGRYAAGKSSTTPDDLAEGVFAATRQRDRLARRDRLHGARHDAGPERLPAAPRRACAAAGHAPAPATSTTSPAATAPASTTCTTASRRRSSRAATSSRSAGGSTTRGEELEPLDEDGRPRRPRSACATRASAPSRSRFLFSYVNPAHELRAAEILARGARRGARSRSRTAVAREWREYERTSSAVLDAYIAPGRRAATSSGSRSEMRDRGLAVPAARDAVERRHRHRASRRATGPLQTLLSGPGRRHDGRRRRSPACSAGRT